MSYNPYDDRENMEQNQTNETESQSVNNEQSAQTEQTSYTEQTAPAEPTVQPVASEPAQPAYTPPQYTHPDVSYHSGPSQNYRATAYVPPVQQPAQPQQTPPQPTSYTWAAGQNQQHNPYYAPVQPVKQKKPKKQRKPMRFLGRLGITVLACAVVSAASVGGFAMMIEHGFVKVESPASAYQTAAFTIYKQEETTESTPTVTGETMTAQEVAAKVTPSVVCIQNYQITQSYSSFFGYSYDSSDSDSSSLSPTGEGSGIIISEDGYILTNQHVIDGATTIKVVTNEGLTYEAELVGEDTQTDLAVIRVINTEDTFTAAEFGSSEDLQVADEVMAIGNPGGLQLNSSVTFGRVSALNRQVTNSETGYTMSCIQTDAAINPGNSGGALVDMNGHVVGINSSKIVSTAYEGLGFAIPADTAQPIVSDLMEYGYVRDRAMLGVTGQYIDRMTASFYGMSSGFYVTQVNSEAAQQAGLQRGDMILAIDDTQVTDETTITTFLAQKKPGDTVTLTLNRYATGEQNVQITLALSENTGLSE